MNAWKRDIVTFIILLAVAGLIGFASHLFFPTLFFLVGFLLFKQLKEIDRFERWIRTGGSGKYPKAKGIWEAIYYHVYRLKKSEKKRKKKLSKMLDQFRKSTEALPDAAVVLGANDEIEWSNKAAMKVLGLVKSDKGQRIPNLIRYPEFNKYLRSNDYNNSIIVPSPINREQILSIRVVSYGAGLRLLLAQDVTQLKKMERMRKDFVANVSHELRTPLTVLKGYLETLKDFDDGESTLLTHSLSQMQDQTDRMEHLVDDLLLLTRLETQKKQPDCVDVVKLLSKICQQSGLPGNYSSRIELVIETETRIRGVEEDLRSAFSNLMINALKYSPEDSVVHVKWYKDMNFFKLDVQDQGEGILPSEISRITERFYRTESTRMSSKKGTGLGLAIVKHVLQNHEAELQISSQIGKGSCFSCCFPSSLECHD